MIRGYMYKYFVICTFSNIYLYKKWGEGFDQSLRVVACRMDRAAKFTFMSNYR